MKYTSHVHPEWKANQHVELESKKTTLIEVVQSLGEYINEEDATIRARTIAYLSEIIGQLSPTFLSRQQTQILCQFLCARIEDGGAVGGLRKLQGLGRFNTELAVTTFRA
jgi:DNA repair/transcription protein MET18/MMS19